MKIQRVAVVGAGTMGAGIAQVLSQSGLEVILKDISQEFVEAGLAKIKKMYDSRVKKEVLTQAEADYLFAMVKPATTYDEFKTVDLVIEAALEQIEVKLPIFTDLDRICPPQAILATNTSALSVSEIASHTKRPEKIIGMHFFNPAQAMKLVEVIPGLSTAPEVTETIVEFCRTLNKIPVRVKECPGFLVNRLLFPYLNEALYALAEGVADANQIDDALVQQGMPMGPLALLDLTGIDVCAHVNNFLYNEYGTRFLPCPLINALADKGHFGQKSGAGIYLHKKGEPYKQGEAKQINPELAKLIGKNAGQKSIPFEAHRLILPMFNEAIFALAENIVEVADVDVAMQWGCGMTGGLLTLAEQKSFSWIESELESYQAAYGERFRPSWLLRKLTRARLKDFGKAKMTLQAVR